MPSCLHPTDNINDLKNFRDFVQRTAFYASIDSKEVRKALIEIPESKASYEEFTKIALEKAEQLVDNDISQEVLQKVEVQQQDTAAAFRADSAYYRGDQKDRGYTRSNSGYGNGNGSSQGSGGDKPKFPWRYRHLRCHKCKELGHIKPICPLLEKKEPAADESEPQAVRSLSLTEAQANFIDIPNVF